ncbi:MAG: nucleoside recognition domain-containing protein [Armatimonadota bacterium]
MSPAAVATAVDYGQPLEQFIARIADLLEDDYRMGSRAVALLLLQDDHRLLTRIREREPRAAQIEQALREARRELGRAPAYRITMRRHQAAAELLADVLTLAERPRRSLRELLSELCINPWTGVPILVLVLYLGLYLFVGKLGAGTLVDWLETAVFDERLLPPVERFIEALLPSETWSSLLVGDYGIITLGVKYAVAIVLPVVGTFFLVFSILEDSGYFPRLALLMDRVFKRIGLNGRAVVPLVLGFGCDTMATMVTRILETRRERIIATLLLALAIPCAAQLGLFAALLSKTSPLLLITWAAVVGAEFLLVGTLASRLMPGRKPDFYMEVPPLRLPKLSNVFTKTYSRMHWYFKEIFPLFVLASVIIWIGRLTHLFDMSIAGLRPVAQVLGFGEHSSRIAEVFLFGFFRRDYSAARLFDLESATNLTNNQLLVGAVTLTLFMPCVAQFLIMKKEHGWGVALAIAGFTFLMAFVVGALLNLFLHATGIQL